MLMRPTRILLLPLLAVMLMSGTAVAAPGDPYVVYTANSFSTGAVILRTEPATGSLVEVSRNGPQGNLFRRPYDLAVESDGKLVVADLGEPNRKDGAVIRVDPLTGVQSLVSSGGEFFDPAGIAVAPDGGIVVANECGAGGGVVLLDPLGLVQRLLTPNGPRDVLVTPERVALDPGGGLLVSDFGAGPDGEGGIVSVDPDTGAQSLVRAGELFNHPLGIAAVVNRPPSAALALPPTVAAGRAVRLDASSSGDPEHLPLVYEWDLDGDGSFEAGSGGTATASRSFATHRPATVRVRVNDPHGGRAVGEGNMMVDGAAPVIGHLRSGARVLAVKWPPRRRKTSPGQGRPRRPAAKHPRAGGERPRAARVAAPRPRAARAAAPKRRRPPPLATTVRFSLTEPATVALAVERARRGRR